MTKSVDNNPPYRICQLMTYYTEDIIKSGLTSALDDGLITSAEYILHDKDDVEPHYHINVAFSKLTRVQSLIKYFDSISDVHQNTFYEQIKGTRFDAHKYLTHSNVSGKEEYDASSIVTIGDDFVKSQKRCRTDNIDSMSIINDILNLETEETLVTKYGRDYVYHYDAWQSMAVRIGRERGVILQSPSDVVKDIYRDARIAEYNNLRAISMYYSSEKISDKSVESERINA